MQVVCAIVIALIPILFSYKQIFSISPTYIVLILLLPYVALKLISKKCFVFKYQGILFLYLFYMLIDHGITLGEVVVFFLFLIYAFATHNRVFNAEILWKVIVSISCIATIGVLIQAFFYYGLGQQILMCPTGMMEPDVWEQYGVDSSYRAGGHEMFRPAAFFLEPSIYSQYVVLAIMYLRLSEVRTKKDLQLAIFLSIGIIVSTSGIGIATIVAVWLLSYGKVIFNSKNFLKGFVGVLFFIVVLIIAFNVSEIFRESALRIVGLGEHSDYNAIAGRTGGVVFMWNSLSGSELWFGKGEYISKWYTWGFLGTFFRIIYEYGLIGVSLFTLLFLSPAFFLKSWQRWMAFYIIVLSLVSGISIQSTIFYYILMYSNTKNYSLDHVVHRMNKAIA